MEKARIIVVFASPATVKEATDPFSEDELLSERRQNERVARWELEFLKKCDKPIFFILTPHKEDYSVLWEHPYAQAVNREGVTWLKFEELDGFLKNKEVVRCVVDSVSAVDVYHSGQEHLLDRFFETASNRAVDALQYEPENPVFNALKLVANANAKSFPPQEFQPFFAIPNFAIPHDSFFLRNEKNQHIPRYDLVATAVNHILDDHSRRESFKSFCAKIKNFKDDKGNKVFANVDNGVVERLYEYFRALRSISVSNRVDRWNAFPQELNGVPRASQLLTLVMHEAYGQKCVWNFRYVPSVARAYDVRDRDGALHTIREGEGFWLSEVPMTTRQWNAVVESSMDRERHDRFWRHGSPEAPVVDVSYNECKKIVRLMGNAGFKFFMPNANEWLRACLARSNKWVEPVSLDSVAWSQNNWRRHKLPNVRLLLPNDWGLFDMIGTVWEFVAKAPNDKFITACGGSCKTNDCTPFSTRAIFDPNEDGDDLGFRVAFRHSDFKRAFGFDLINTTPIEGIGGGATMGAS